MNQTQHITRPLNPFYAHWQALEGVPDEVLQTIKRGHEIKFMSGPPPFTRDSDLVRQQRTGLVV